VLQARRLWLRRPAFSSNANYNGNTTTTTNNNNINNNSNIRGLDVNIDGNTGKAATSTSVQSARNIRNNSGDDYSNGSILIVTFRLRRWQSQLGAWLVGGKEGVVLQARELRLWCSVKRNRNSDSTNNSSSSSSSNDNGYSNDSIFLCTLRLRRRQSKVGTGLVGGEEGVVLQSQRLRVPRAPRNSNVHYHNNEAIREISTFRLRRWKGKVGTGVVGEKASVVLPARGRRLWRCHNFGDKLNGNSDIAYGNNISINGNRVHVCKHTHHHEQGERRRTRPVRLLGRAVELGPGVVAQEAGVVLPPRGPGLRHDRRLRLRGGLLGAGQGVVGEPEGLVLPPRGQGLCCRGGLPSVRLRRDQRRAALVGWPERLVLP